MAKKKRSDATGERMTLGTLSAILDNEKQSAMSSARAGKLAVERTRALHYYNGDVSGDIESDTNRSQAVSSDVSDTIDGMMAPLMDIFGSGRQVVKFNPVGEKDVVAAEQETDFVNHVFMEQNPGWLILYTMIKDALLSKIGTVKVAWEASEQQEEDVYYDLDDTQLALLVNDPEIAIIEHTIKDRPDDNDPDTDPSSNVAYS